MMRRSFNARFFKKGWDNASLDVIYRGLLRKPEVNQHLREKYFSLLDGRTERMLSACHVKAQQNKTATRIFLAPDMGDPHRLLKAYSLTAYPILNERGDVMKCDVDGQMMDAFADPDDDFSKVCIPHLDTVIFLSQQLLETMKWEATPRGAASLLESLYRGAEVPDHVFATRGHIEREW